MLETYLLEDNPAWNPGAWIHLTLIICPNFIVIEGVEDAFGDFQLDISWTQVSNLAVSCALIAVIIRQFIVLIL